MAAAVSALAERNGAERGGGGVGWGGGNRESGGLKASLRPVEPICRVCETTLAAGLSQLHTW
jgi:hypothetical protein